MPYAPRTLFAAAGVAVIGLVTACGTQSAPVAAAPPAPARAAATSAPRTCAQQYAVWKKGPAVAPGKKLTAAIAAFQSVGATDDIPETLKAIEAAGTEAARLAQYPMPACADPHGYWTAMLIRVKAAGDNAGSSSGVAGLLATEAPLQAVSGLETKLDAELKKNT